MEVMRDKELNERNRQCMVFREYFDWTKSVLINLYNEDKLKVKGKQEATMRELIPSKDVREYMEKKGKRLTDFEKATLAYNYPDTSIGERLEMLKRDHGHDAGSEAGGADPGTDWIS